MDKLISLGAQLEFFGEDCVETENHARAEAVRQDQVYVSPYNDTEVKPIFIVICSVCRQDCACLVHMTWHD